MWKLLHTKIYQSVLSLRKKDYTKYTEEKDQYSQAPRHSHNFSEKNIHNKDKFYQRSTCQDSNSFIGSDQQDLIAQYLVSKTLAGAEVRVKQG